jgi:hypothetical protein
MPYVLFKYQQNTQLYRNCSEWNKLLLDMKAKAANKKVRISHTYRNTRSTFMWSFIKWLVKNSIIHKSYSWVRVKEMPMELDTEVYVSISR